MSLERKWALAALNDLIATCKDGESGYRCAVEDIDSPELKALFAERQRERATFAAELLEAAHRIETPEEREGGLLARVHRGWMNLKATLTRREPSAIVAECLRGEEAALRDYEAALALELPPEVTGLLEKQYDTLKESYERVRLLKGIGILNDLVAVCRDAEAGYRLAAEHATEPELKAFLEGLAAQRTKFAAELEAEVRKLGGDRVAGGTLIALAHRGLMGLRAIWAKENPEAVLSECERGERLALKHYAAAMEGELPRELEQMVESQWAEVKKALADLAGWHVTAGA